MKDEFLLYFYLKIKWKKKYHTGATVLKYHTGATVLKYHTGATVPISERKSLERGKFDFKTHNYTTVHFPALIQAP